MFNSRISSIIRKEFLQLFRDPRTLALAVVIPNCAIIPVGICRHIRCAEYPHGSLGPKQIAAVASVAGCLPRRRLFHH